MNKEEFIKYIELEYSIAKLAEHFKKSKGSIRHWLKKFELKTNKNKYNWNNKIDESTTHKVCNGCGIKKSITDKKELDKCICLCSVCHRIEHYRLRQKGVQIIK